MADTVIGAIAVQIKAKNDNLVNGLKEANTSIKNFGSSFTKNFGALSAVVAGFGVAAYAALKSTVDSAAESEKAHNALAIALRNAGDATKAGLDDQVAYAEALQKTTAFSNDQVMAGQAELAQFGLTGNALKQAVRLSADLAAAKGIDLVQASENVGKAFIGETGRLKQFGIVVDESTPKADRFGIVMQQIQERFGGSAANERNGYIGQIKAMGNAFDDLKKEAGMLFLPIFTKVAKAMTDFFENKLGPAIQIIKDAIHEFGGFGNTLKIVGLQLVNVGGLLDNKIAKLQASGRAAAQAADIEKQKEFEKAQAAALAEQQKQAATLAAQLAGEQSRIALAEDEAAQNKAREERITAEDEEIHKGREIAAQKWRDAKIKAETEMRAELEKAAQISESAMTDLFSRELDAREKKQRIFHTMMKTLQTQITTAFIEGQAKQTAASIAASRTQVAADKPAIASGFFKAHASIPFVGQVIALTAIAAAFAFIDRLVKFNKGGVVEGTGSGDTVPAMLTPGERVLTREQNKAFENGASVGGGGGGNTFVFNVSGMFVDADESKWRDLMRRRIIPEVQRHTMISPTSAFIRRRGATA
jgi:hypothetical protein